MDGQTLMECMSYPGYAAPMGFETYTSWAEACNLALVQAGCNNRFRVAGYLSQIGAESGSMRWTAELADGSEYNWRADLGNTQAGDGPRYKGRSFIQVTGRAHYGELSRWMFKRGLVPSETYFLDQPELLSSQKFAFLGATWYWVGAHPHDGYSTLNQAADIAQAGGPAVSWANTVMTHMVNGGENNIGGRLARFQKCLSLGDRILPSPVHPLPYGGSEVRYLKSNVTGKFYQWGPGQHLVEVSEAAANNYAKVWNTKVTEVSKHFLQSVNHHQRLALRKGVKL